MNTSFCVTFHPITSGARIPAAALCLLATLAPGCAELDAPSETGEDVLITVASQAIGTAPPAQDPQLCALPQGRYVVLATPTTLPNVYNVVFHDDAVPGSQPSSLCKTMTFVWKEEGTAPVPPVIPFESEFHTMLFEGWWIPSPVGARRFAVKAVWQTSGSQGVVTGVNNIPAFGYAITTCDLDVACNKRFNWMGPGTDMNRSFTMDWEYHIPEQGTVGRHEKDGTIAITGPSQDINGHLSAVQFLYLQSGTARIFGPDALATRPCMDGYWCLPVAP